MALPTSRPSASTSRSDPGQARGPQAASCLHCGAPITAGQITAGPGAARGFCCTGCEAAYGLVRGLGLESYYARRRLNLAARPLKPDPEAPPQDLSAFVTTDAAGINTLNLMVEGLHCAACVWLIESVLSRQADVVQARINMTTRRFVVKWRGDPERAGALVGLITSLGYRLVPYDPVRLGNEATRRDRELLRAMAVAGFAAGNVMLLSISVWAGHSQGMGPATRDLLHWFSALIALPAIVYAGWPFYRSAFTALRAGRTNMDVPISLAVLLAAGMSLFETISGGEYVYFDASVTLLFFLLVGRYLDSRARTRARSAAESLVSLGAGAVTVEDGAGAPHLLPPSRVRPGMTAIVAAGERIAVDGRVCDGASDVDTSLITGESVPGRVAVGEKVFAGTLNLTGPLRVTVTGAGETTLLAEIVRLMEAAEQGRARYVALAERVARAYAPVVHILGLLTFVGWMTVMGAPWQVALLNAVAVLIVTCPCALALAVPVVQVVAGGRLMRRGILLKSPTALERMSGIDTVIFDKTGTLTLGRPRLLDKDRVDGTALRTAAALAGASRHPLAQALHRAAGDVPVATGVEEVPGSGLRLGTPEGEVRLGSHAWCTADGAPAKGIPADGAPAKSTQAEGTQADGGSLKSPAQEGPELWLSRPGHALMRFGFADDLREDAKVVVAALKAHGLHIELLSGDRSAAVRAAAAGAGIEHWRAACSPAAKTARLEALATSGRHVLMVGDGLNDAPALAAAHVSISPSTAADISQTAADAIFQGRRLTPILETLAVARKADRLVRQNFALAFLYNAVTIPLAVAGLVTPLVAAVAMSASSLVVTANALRLAHGRPVRTSSSI